MVHSLRIAAEIGIRVKKRVVRTAGVHDSWSRGTTYYWVVYVVLVSKVYRVITSRLVVVGVVRVLLLLV